MVKQLEDVEATAALDVDMTRPNATARCPFSCPGRYVAGYHASNGRAFVVHSLPWCDRFTVTPPERFLREARIAGAQVTRVTPEIARDHHRDHS